MNRVLHTFHSIQRAEASGFRGFAEGLCHFFRLEASAISFSHVHAVHSGQAGTPRGHDAAAVGQSEALAVGVRLPFPIMKNATSAPIIGMFARKVASVTGLSARELENLHPEDFGSPAHWRFIGGTEGGMLYTPRGLCVLVEALREAGFVAQSTTLAAFVREGGLAITPAVASEPVAELAPVSYAPPPRSRLLEWEDAHS